MKRSLLILLVFASVPALALGAEPQKSRLKVGVKKYTESAILGEMVAQLARHAGADCTTAPPARSVQVWASFQNEKIHAYVDYTGTLKLFLPDEGKLESELAKLGIEMIPLGFANNYAVGMLEEQAKQKNISRISDLARAEHKNLILGFDLEFLRRQDGWGGLKKHYNLPQFPTLVEHPQSYQTLAEGKVAAIDCYTTDGALSQDSPRVRLLEDDQEFFPRYKAVLLVRTRAVPERVLTQWRRLKDQINRTEMQQMNAQVSATKLEHQVAAQFLKDKIKVAPTVPKASDTPLPPIEQRKKVHIRIGAKSFTESVILAQMAAHLIRATGATCQVTNLGGSEMVWNALRNDDIDLYAEYTGTLRAQLLRGVRDLEPVLERDGIRMSQSLGFKNNYGLGMLEKKARALNITKISDLLKKEHSGLKFGCSHEFLERKDGWLAVHRKYPLTHEPQGLNHDLAYPALAKGSIDVMEVATTDGDIDYYKMTVLDDDRGCFTIYDAVLLYRPGRVPPWLQKVVIGKLEGQISEKEMREMNYRAKQERVGETKVAADLLNEKFGMNIQVADPGVSGVVADILYRSWEHFLLVLISLSAAVLLGLPLGILAARRVASRPVILSAVGVMQTLPSLAVLTLLVAIGVGIGTVPAIITMFLYCLLPIVMGTYTGLIGVPTSMRETVASMGLPPRASLFLVELPMASRSILTGVKTSAIICVSLGTLGAFIGAGGYGVDILSGVRLNNTARILQGAIPAVLMALAVMGLFSLAERVVLPKGLRIQSA